MTDTERVDPDPPANLIRSGITALREGDRNGARSLFQALSRRYPESAKVWLWLAAAADTSEERRMALEKALVLDPHSALARKGLAALGTNLASEEEKMPELPPEAIHGRQQILRRVFVLLLVVLTSMAVLAVAFVWRPTQSASSTNAEPTADSRVTPLVPTLTPVPSATVLQAEVLQAPTSSPAPPTPAPPGSFFAQDGWRYGLLAGPQSTSLDRIADLTPNGRFIVVMLTVANTSNTPRPLDPALVTLVDAAGRSHEPQPAASLRYLESTGGRGISGDLALGEVVPNTGGNLSIPIVFDIPLDATNLMLVVGNSGTRMGWILP